MSTRILIVRLSALGDIVHAVPVLSAIRRHDPSAEIDWLVEESYAAVLGMVDGLRRRIIVRARENGTRGRDVVFASGLGYLKAAYYLRRQHYDVALDLQGLIKSAAWARVSGARRVIGFAPGHLREPHAARLYTEAVTPPEAPHIIQKNLAMAAHLGAPVSPFTLPLSAEPSPALSAALQDAVGPARYAVLEPRGGVAEQTVAARALWRARRSAAASVRPGLVHHVGPFGARIGRGDRRVRPAARRASRRRRRLPISPP